MSNENKSIQLFTGTVLFRKNDSFSIVHPQAFQKKTIAPNYLFYKIFNVLFNLRSRVTIY